MNYVVLLLLAVLAVVKAEVASLNILLTPFSKNINWEVDLDYPVTYKNAFNYAVSSDAKLRNQISRYPTLPNTDWHFTPIPFQVPKRYSDPNTRIPKGTTQIIISYDYNYDFAEKFNNLSEEEELKMQGLI